MTFYFILLFQIIDLLLLKLKFLFMLSLLASNRRSLHRKYKSTVIQEAANHVMLEMSNHGHAGNTQPRNVGSVQPWSCRKHPTT